MDRYKNYYKLTFKNRKNDSKIFVKAFMTDLELSTISLNGYQLVESKKISFEEFSTLTISLFKA